MNVKVKLFALAAQLAGTNLLEVSLDGGATVADLRRRLTDAVPALAPMMPHLLISINSDYAIEAMTIPPGAEVACFPPVSGG